VNVFSKPPNPYSCKKITRISYRDPRTSFPSWWSDWKQGSFAFSNNTFHPCGGLIYLKIDPRDKIEYSRFAKKVMYNNFEKEKNSQL
jgi:hypothetical protein